MTCVLPASRRVRHFSAPALPPLYATQWAAATAKFKDRPVLIYDVASRGSQSYLALARELEARRAAA